MAQQKRKTVLIAAAVVFVLGLGYFGYEHFMYVSTDNATVQAHTVMLASKVPGLVTQVAVVENQRVKAGDLLVKIDERDYRNTLEQIESEMSSLQARVADSERNYKRLADLYKKSAVSQQQFEAGEAAYREQSRKLAALRAQVDQARLNLSSTEVRASVDGIVARKSVEVGMMASPGQPLVGFVGADERWVTANFKETEISDITPGRKASIKVDALPGREFRGEVESLSPSTGATFTLLPPDNATGNFTKVVQRVPVRIKLVSLTAQDIEALKAGLSAVVSVRVH